MKLNIKTEIHAVDYLEQFLRLLFLRRRMLIRARNIADAWCSDITSQLMIKRIN